MQTLDNHGAGSTSSPEFVNHGLLYWTQTRKQWIGNKKQEIKEPQHQGSRPRKMSIETCKMATMARVCMKHPLLIRSRPVLLFNTPRSIGSMQSVVRPPPISCSYSSSAQSSVQASSGEKDQASKEQTSTSLVDSSRGDRGGMLWRNPLKLLPFRLGNNGLGSFGNALVQASHNLNRLLENWSPSRLLGRVKENEECYKLRFEVPGLSREDLRITVEDGFLVITGERNEEEKSYEDDGNRWYSEGYGFYSTSLLLPEDAKVEGIKARVKDGVLYVTIPRSQKEKKNVREVEIH